MKVLGKNPSFTTSESKKKIEKQEIEKAINFILTLSFVRETTSLTYNYHICALLSISYLQFLCGNVSCL